MPLTTADRDRVAERRTQVAALLLASLTQREIAERLEVSLGTVNSDVQAIRAEWSERRSTTYDAWVAEQLAVLDRLQRSMIPLATTGNAGAVDRVLAIMDRRTRLLGLDKPQQHEHVVLTKDVVTAEIERLEAELARRASEEQPAG